MSSSARRAALLTAVPTPFTASEDLDRGLVDAVMRAVAETDVDGAFVAGTTGEFTALTDAERLTVITSSLEHLGPERTYAHVGAATARQAERLVADAVAAGATRLAAITPYYFPAPGPAVVDYFARLVEAAAGADVYAYLFTARTTTAMTPALLPALSAVGLQGIKISGATEETVLGFIRSAPAGFEVWSGNDLAFPELVAAGGHGVISGVSSVFPGLFVALRDALRAGDADAVAAIRPRIARAVEVVRGGSIAHLKAGVELRGLPAGPIRIASHTVDDADRAAIKEALHDLG